MTSTRDAFNQHKAAFIYVLAGLEQNGIKLHDGEGPEALGIPAAAFDHLVRDCAVATWDIHSKKTPSPSDQKFNWFDYISSFPNLHEMLEMTKADLSTDSGFASLGVTKNDFEQTCRQAILLTLQAMPGYAKLSESGGQALFNQVLLCMKIAQVDPADDALFQRAGFASRAGFDAQLAEWKKAAVENPVSAHSCCGGACTPAGDAPPAATPS